MMKRWLPWIGWLLSIGAVSILLMSARWKLTFDPWYVKEWGRIGWDPSMLPRIALIQLACVALYLTPRTAVLGAVLLTGYLGGAISQYTRLEEPYPFWFPCPWRCSPGRDSTYVSRVCGPCFRCAVGNRHRESLINNESTIEDRQSKMF